MSTFQAAGEREKTSHCIDRTKVTVIRARSCKADSKSTEEKCEKNSYAPIDAAICRKFLIGQSAYTLSIPHSPKSGEKKASKKGLNQRSLKIKQARYANVSRMRSFKTPSSIIVRRDKEKKKAEREKKENATMRVLTKSEAISRR